MLITFWDENVGFSHFPHFVRADMLSFSRTIFLFTWQSLLLRSFSSILWEPNTLERVRDPEIYTPAIFLLRVQLNSILRSSSVSNLFNVTVHDRNQRMNSTVTLIIGLIILGLVIDLGGGPNHERKGFQVCTCL